MNGEKMGITEEVMEKINRHAVGELKGEQVYCFSVLLCDNDVDRDYERFSDEALDRLAGLFVGRTGIFDHDHSSRGQTARIYDTEVRSYPERKTADGRAYRALIGFAYMVRTEDNKSLIAEIEGGIKKEVSVGCSVAKRICSVCGADGAKGGCSHIKGRSYGGKLCYVTLDEPVDAYEWSFVAVPAQRAAGVTKVYGGSDIDVIREMQACFCEDLRADIIRLGSFVKSADIGEVDGLDVFALLELKKKLSRQLREEAASGKALGVAAYEGCDSGEMEAFRV
ncbi:hypothetical protein [Ruminococcus albus]|uniref:Uncharacterized protein n=1 Tax=Ruminococcus albus TaxID=1264 RepID=A0A1H7PYJ2_RUMAL|nr:hypothetical protein [Ruminococcus albus]SEL40335.1 hypothetical protein SAMN05216469_12615 [Ruminococcus albus]